MTELSTPTRCMMGGGRARATRDHGSEDPGGSLVARCSVFKDHSAGSAGFAASNPLARSEKRPLVVRGPRLGRTCAGRIWIPRYEVAPSENRRKSDRGV